ncbi:hypothetical protein HYR82_02875 [Candidatus Peregrinibacteria bacterium]|nr:hypothetical protein [Candidatus Peregrinibacteria bacterium]
MTEKKVRDGPGESAEHKDQAEQEEAARLAALRQNVTNETRGKMGKALTAEAQAAKEKAAKQALAKNGPTKAQEEQTKKEMEALMTKQASEAAEGQGSGEKTKASKEKGVGFFRRTWRRLFGKSEDLDEKVESAKNNRRAMTLGKWFTRGVGLAAVGTALAETFASAGGAVSSVTTLGAFGEWTGKILGGLGTATTAAANVISSIPGVGSVASVLSSGASYVTPFLKPIVDSLNAHVFIPAMGAALPASVLPLLGMAAFVPAAVWGIGGATYGVRSALHWLGWGEKPKYEGFLRIGRRFIGKTLTAPFWGSWRLLRGAGYGGGVAGKKTFEFGNATRKAVFSKPAAIGGALGAAATVATGGAILPLAIPAGVIGGAIYKWRKGKKGRAAAAGGGDSGGPTVPAADEAHGPEGHADEPHHAMAA